VVEAEERERVLGRVSLGLPSSLDVKRNRTNRRGFSISLAPERRISSRSTSSPLVGLQEKETEEREKRIGKGKVHLAGFQIQNMNYSN
jgi:hypothetical protein